MRRPLLPSLALAVLACQPRAATDVPEGSAEPTAADQPAVFAEVESLPRDEAEAEAQTKHVAPGLRDPGVELDWQVVDASLSDMIPGPRKRIDYDAAHPYFGAAEPIVTALVFVDYQCPFCAGADAQLRELVAAYPDEVRVVVRMMPLSSHPHALDASMAALAALEQGQFEAMHELLFQNHDALERADLERYALSLGLDLDRFRADLDEPALRERIAADRALAEAAGVMGVPTIYVNGRELMDLSTADALVHEERALADAMVEAGAPRREIWARIMAASQDLSEAP